MGLTEACCNISVEETRTAPLEWADYAEPQTAHDTPEERQRALSQSLCALMHQLQCYLLLASLFLCSSQTFHLSPF